MKSVLRSLQRALSSSWGDARWTSAFGICFEEVQRTTHVNQDADAQMGKINEREATQTAEEASRVIDDKFKFMVNLFRKKYQHNLNPLKCYDKPEARENLSESSLAFVRDVAALVHEKSKFIPFIYYRQSC
jgi:hypothetical protein